MKRRHTLAIDSASLSFSSGHFTIFSAIDRENLHGHDYQLAATLSTWIGESGISFDYRDYKNKMKALCDRLNSLTLLPSHNPHLHVEQTPEKIIAIHNQQRMEFLPRDALVLPIRNTTLEELSHWFLTEFVEQHRQQLAADCVDAIDMRLSTRPGQTGTSFWQASVS